MTMMTATYEKTAVLHRELFDEGLAPNFICTDKDGLLFNPDTAGEVVDALAYNTHKPMETNDFIWNSIVIDTLRQADAGATDEFEIVFTLQGITANGYIRDLGVKVLDTCPETLTSYPITFDLFTSACKSSLSNESGSASAGKMQATIPKFYEDYESITLNRNWIDGWLKRKMIPITGSTSTVTDRVIGPITITYDADMQADFDDIRFADYNGKTELLHTRPFKTDSTSAVYYVKVPSIPATAISNIYAYYDNDSAEASDNLVDWMTLFSGYSKKDDWEDGKVTGRAAPYEDWAAGGGSVTVESANPLSGSYSMRHTGSGADSKSNIARRWNETVAYTVEYDFKVATQGTDANSPTLNLWQAAYEDINNWLLVETYWNAASGKQKIELRRNNVSTINVYQTNNWLSSRLSTAGGPYHFKLEDTGSHINVYIDGVRYINFDYSIGSVNRHYKGMGANHDSAMIVDNYSFNTSIVNPTLGAVGSEESTITVTPDTPASTDLSILFSTPADWSARSYSYLNVKEHDTIEYPTRAISLSNLGKFVLGYDGLDSFDALRVKIEARASDEYSFSIPRIVYSYHI
jgi:hypothetical protein